MIVKGRSIRPLYKVTLVNQFMKEDRNYYRRERTRQERKKIKNLLIDWRTALLNTMGFQLQKNKKEVEAMKQIVFCCAEKARASSYSPTIAINYEMKQIYNQMKNGLTPGEILKTFEED